VKRIVTLGMALCLSVWIAAAQSNAPSAKRTDVYHIHFAKAALGKVGPLGDYLKTPDPKAPMPGHVLVLRHQAGDAWDYVEVEHEGTKATIDSSGRAAAPDVRDRYEWHNDTFVVGPPWAEFTAAMGIGSQAASTVGSVYVVSVYRAAPGHRDGLLKELMAPPEKGDTSVGNVILAHLEGADWNFFGIARYKSYQDYGVNETNSIAQTKKGAGGWVTLRDHVAYHVDTLADRIAP